MWCHRPTDKCVVCYLLSIACYWVFLFFYIEYLFVLWLWFFWLSFVCVLAANLDLRIEILYLFDTNL